jgi:hypothetical protein
MAQNNGYDEEQMSDVDIHGGAKGIRPFQSASNRPTCPARPSDKPEKQQPHQHMSKSMINASTGSTLVTNTKLHGLYAATTYISDDEQDNHIHITGNPMSSVSTVMIA